MLGRGPDSAGGDVRWGCISPRSCRNRHVRGCRRREPEPPQGPLFSAEITPLRVNRAFSFLKALLIFSHFPPLSSEQLGSRESGRRRSPIALWKPGPEPVGLQVPQEPLPPGPVGSQWSQRALGVSRRDLFQLGGHSRDEVSLCGLRAPLVPRHPETPTDPHPDSLGPGCRSRNSWLVLPGSELLGAGDPSCPLYPLSSLIGLKRTCLGDLAGGAAGHVTAPGPWLGAAWARGKTTVNPAQDSHGTSPRHQASQQEHPRPTRGPAHSHHPSSSKHQEFSLQGRDFSSRTSVCPA